MPEELEKLIRTLIAQRFTGSIEIHFKDGVALKVHEQRYITLRKDEVNGTPQRTMPSFASR